MDGFLAHYFPGPTKITHRPTRGGPRASQEPLKGPWLKKVQEPLPFGQVWFLSSNLTYFIMRNKMKTLTMNNLSEIHLVNLHSDLV